MKKAFASNLCALFFLGAIAAPLGAHASGPQAWEQHDEDVATACVAASGLAKAQAQGKPVVFDDRVAQTALLLAGTYPQKHMAGKKGQVLCLYDRKTRTAQTQEWTPVMSRK